MGSIVFTRILIYFWHFFLLPLTLDENNVTQKKRKHDCERVTISKREGKTEAVNEGR